MLCLQIERTGAMHALSLKGTIATFRSLVTFQGGHMASLMFRLYCLYPFGASPNVGDFPSRRCWRRCPWPLTERPRFSETRRAHQRTLAISPRVTPRQILLRQNGAHNRKECTHIQQIPDLHSALLFRGFRSEISTLRPPVKAGNVPKRHLRILLIGDLFAIVP
jgi:hypothetical protein